MFVVGTCWRTNIESQCNVYESTSLGVDGANTYNYFNNFSNSASTTGNKTGVYDMSGGSGEYVMGVMMDQNGNLVSGIDDRYNSNFIGTLTYTNDGNNTSKTSWTEADGGIPYPEEKYYDVYSYVSAGANLQNFYFNYRILGDATGEMGPFEFVSWNPLVRIGSWYENNHILYIISILGLYEADFLILGEVLVYLCLDILRVKSIIL